MYLKIIIFVLFESYQESDFNHEYNKFSNTKPDESFMMFSPH